MNNNFDEKNKDILTLNELKLLIQFNISNETIYKVLNSLYSLDLNTLIQLKVYVCNKSSKLTHEIVFNYENNNNISCNAYNDAIEEVEKCFEIEKVINDIVNEYLKYKIYPCIK